MELTRSAYRMYLRSDHWRQLRAEKCALSPRCERCDSKARLQVHHVRYGRWEDGQIGDLRTLCASCHAAEHGKRDRVRRKKASKNTKRVGRRVRRARVGVLQMDVNLTPRLVPGRALTDTDGG